MMGKRGLFILIFGLVYRLTTFAQLTDLMIVEYVDTDVPYNDGYGIKIYNPTNASINLSSYYVKLYHNGNTNVTAGTTDQLSGTITAGGIFIVGNQDYCDMCTSDCDFEMSALDGVNSNDVVALSKSSSNNTFVDMIGPYKTDVNSVVDDTIQALLHHKLIRECDNDLRYFNIASTSGPTNNSWYSNTTSMPGWIVDSISCLTQNNWVSEIELDLPDTILCLGDSVLYDLSTVTSDSIKWVWDNDSTTLESPFLKDTGRYIVDVFGNCSGKDTFYIYEIKGVDVLGLDIKDTSFCEGDPFYRSIKGITNDRIIWSLNGSELEKDSILIADTGMYVVQVFASCGAIDTFHVGYTFIPTIDISDTTICEGSSVFYNLSSFNFNSTKWVNSNGTLNTSSDTISISESGVYTIGGFLGCFGDEKPSTGDTFTIEVISCNSKFLIPNIITPNGDKTNDAFVLSGLNGKPIRVTIYNRWGKLVYKDDDYQNDWEAKGVTDGQYYYEIEDAITNYKGWLSILR